jgi:hypothetical protein
MSQKISPISLRLYYEKGFNQNFYSEIQNINLWKNNIYLMYRYKKILDNNGLLRLRRNAINRRLRLKHNGSSTSLNVLTNFIVSTLPYKNKINLFIFKKALTGVQFSYSIRSMQRRKKQVYFKK